jgi:hypothetical protein
MNCVAPKYNLGIAPSNAMHSNSDLPDADCKFLKIGRADAATSDLRDFGGAAAAGNKTSQPFRRSCHR